MVVCNLHNQSFLKCAGVVALIIQTPLLSHITMTLDKAKVGCVMVSDAAVTFAKNYPALSGFLIFWLCLYFIGNIWLDGILLYRNTCLAFCQIKKAMTSNVATKPDAV